MEKHFLDDLIRKIDPDAKKGSHKNVKEIWYNKYGDCIEFIAVDEATVADRIDDYLTIYRSAESDEPIGFKIKDIVALIKKNGYDLIIEDTSLLHLISLIDAIVIKKQKSGEIERNSL